VKLFDYLNLNTIDYVTTMEIILAFFGIPFVLFVCCNVVRRIKPPDLCSYSMSVYNALELLSYRHVTDKCFPKTNANDHEDRTLYMNYFESSVNADLC
jgi:hypothetical protein